MLFSWCASGLRRLATPNPDVVRLRGAVSRDNEMRVLMISKSQIAAAYHGKLRELAGLGIDLTVVVPPRWGKHRLEVREAGDYALRVRPSFLSGYNHFYFYTRGIGPVDADLVHLEEEPWSLVTWQVLRRCVKLGKPVIFFTWQNLYKRYPQPFAYFERYTFAHAQAAIAGNEEALNILRARGFSKPARVIPQLGVDPQFFCRREVQELRSSLRLQNTFAIGYVGRVVPEKGIADLVRALALLPHKCVLVMVGDGPFRRHAERLAAETGVASRIRWVPHVASLQVPQYMSALDVLALPSRTIRRWKEQFGRVLIEAMACETPVVGSDSGEIPKVIADAGLIFPEGDVEALADRLRFLCEQPGFRKTLGSRGRARVLSMFTHRVIAGETVDFYRQVLGASMPRAMPAHGRV